MSVKTKQVPKDATAKGGLVAGAVSNRVRGVAGNHTFLNANEREDELNPKEQIESVDIPYLTVEEYKELATAMYVGGNANLPSTVNMEPTDRNYTNRGILDYKLDAITEMQSDLNKQDSPPIEEQILRTVLIFGVRVGAAYLAPYLGTAAQAVLAGGAAVALEIPKCFMKDSKMPINVTGFTGKLSVAVREGWPKSVTTLQSKMANEKTARQVVMDVSVARGNPDEVKQIQKNEVLDEWLNAVNWAKSGGKGSGETKGMGEAAYYIKWPSEVVPGRVELHTAGLYESDYSSSPKFVFSLPTRVRVGGLPNQDLRDMLADRKLSDIKVARTMRMGVSSMEGGSFGEALTDTIAVGINPAGEMSLAKGEQSTNFAKSVLASYYETGKSLDADNMWIFEGGHDQPEIEKTWAKGLEKVWAQVLDKKLKELNSGKPITEE